MNAPRQMSEPEAWRALARRIDAYTPGQVRLTRADDIGADIWLWMKMSDRVRRSQAPGEWFTYKTRDDIEAAVIAALWFACEAEDESCSGTSDPAQTEETR